MQEIVNDEPVQAYEGKVQDSVSFPTSIISKLASELIYFGKLVTPYDDAELAVGGASGGPQRVKAPTSAAEITRCLKGGGIAIADPSVERMRNPAAPGTPNSAPFGAFASGDMLPVMRKGRIWVVVETELTDLDSDVYVRFQNPGGSPPAAQLGSFTQSAGADFDLAPSGAFAFQGAATIGGVHFALMAVNLPA
jgi:hypothetical protein